MIINRTVADPFNRGSRAYQSERSVRTAGGVLPVVPGTFSNVASSGVEAVVESRGKEKKDMQDLNERLANYLEKVRILGVWGVWGVWRVWGSLEGLREV